MDDLLKTAVRAAEMGAEQLLERWATISVREKAPRDLVTDADLASQEAIFNVLQRAFPEDRLVGEEQGMASSVGRAAAAEGPKPRCWIVDPLDGTVNYVHRLQSFCVSIALVESDQLQVGVVLDPVADELYVARRGQGAWLITDRGARKRALRVSSCSDLPQAMVACSFPAGVRRDAPEVGQFVSVLETCRALRRLGSCALNLCYLADGRIDGYWTQSVKPWDMAAGALLVEEAGGKITSMRGTPLQVWEADFIAAATPQLHRQLQSVVTA